MQNGSLRGPRGDALPNTIQEDVGRSSLHEAASVGDEKTLQALLASGADRNTKDIKHGNTPLHEASWRGFSRCVKLLCALPQAKVNKDVRENKIKGVLQETRGALHSALLGTRNAGGFSALHLAAQNGHNQSCREILLAGADPDVQNNYGDTALHTACRYGHAGATRILLSAKCDPNRTNLNGDSPLHISCAMSRRKLTRILLEAGSNLEIKNAQKETPRDIALRKNLPEILEILDNPVEIKFIKDRDRSSSNTKSADRTDGLQAKASPKRSDYVENPVNWSPYGCHYFPDPRSFPSPKLETLPKEPLGKGEQYYLDLAGNIRKGPIGVGNTCYCGPFFRHIEERISRNRKSLRKYVHRATERLDNKVQALALRTDDQIEQLTRSMMAERIRCEGRRLHLEQWLKRGEPTRVTVSHHSKSKKNIDNVNTLTRCRSLELLDEGDSLENITLQNSRSFDMLDECNVIVHRNPEPSDVHAHALNPSSLDSDLKTSEKSQVIIENGVLSRNSYCVSKRLEELLAKTNKILEMEKIVRRRNKEISSKSKNKDNERAKHAPTPNRHSMHEKQLVEKIEKMSLEPKQYLDEDINATELITREMNKISNSLSRSELDNNSKLEELPSLSPEIAKDFSSQKELERRSDQEHEKSSILSESSQKNASSRGSGYFPDFSNLRSNCRRHELEEPLHKADTSNEHFSNPVEYHNVTEPTANVDIKFKNLLSALRRDYDATKQSIQTEFFKESIAREENFPHALHQSFEHPVMIFSEDVVDFPNENRMLHGFYQNACFNDTIMSSNNTFKSQKRHFALDRNYVPDPEESTELSEMAHIDEITELKSRILNGSNWRSQVLKKSQEMLNTSHENSNTKGINGIVQKFEIKNSEIKTLKTPTSGILKRSKVQQLVAKIQGNASDSKHPPENSESSEDEGKSDTMHIYANKIEDFHNEENDWYYYYNRAQPQVAVTLSHSNDDGCMEGQPHEIVSSSARILETRNLIPKDAYFHDLPNKNRMRPIVDKLPEKQMLNFADKCPNAHPMMARTRNPLPFLNEYDISLTSNGQNNANIQYQGNNSSPMPDNISSHGGQIAPTEKLLSHRKFAFSSAVDYELSRINYNQQQHGAPHRIQQNLSATEQTQVERDTNNDSGYSTKICSSSHGPSPSLSGHIDLGGESGSTDQLCEYADNSDVTCFIGNVGASSLV